MIKLLSLNKSFGIRSNRCHVLKDISLELPSNGLIAICGESGCGKSTLLNCIGGTDNAKGSINVCGCEFGRLSAKTDRFRSINIGYIYQNYELVENRSVRYNLQLAIDIAKTSQKDDSKRIIDVLEKVGMAKYLKRNVNTLSGGQKQRVAIARAIINSPKVILADEPTGHLDSDNTLRVMDILKSLSEKILVIWVSHEKELVNMYADRIINLYDGRIVGDKDNKSSKNTCIQKLNNDKNIYLNEYKKFSFAEEKISTDVYVKDETEKKIILLISDNTVNIVVPKGYTVQAISETYLQEKEVMKKELEDNSTAVNVISMLPVNYTGRKSKKRKRLVTVINKKNIISIIGFMFAAIFMAVSMSFNDFGKKIDYTALLQYHMNTVQVDIVNELSEADFEELTSINSIDEILPYSELSLFRISDGNFLQTNIEDRNGKLFQTSVLKYDYSSDLIVGRMPTKADEVLIDEMLITSMLNENDESDNITKFGYVDINNFINSKLKLENSKISLKIVGITKKSAPAIYVSDEMLVSVALKKSMKDNYDVYIYSDSLFPNLQEPSENQVYLCERLFQETGCSINDEFKLNDKKYIVKGSFPSEDNASIIINNKVGKDILEERFFEQTSLFLIMSNNPEETIIELRNLGYNANSILEITKTVTDDQLKTQQTARQIITIIVIFSAGLIYFMSEKSMIAKRKEEISIKRALGMSKMALFRTFVLESIFKVSVVTIPIYLLTAYIINDISSNLGNVLSIDAILIVNLVIGLGIIISVAVMTTFLSCLIFINKTSASLLKTD